MDLVQRSGGERQKHGDQCPIELPRITEENTPGALQHRFQPVAMGMLQGQERKRTQDGVAREVSYFAHYFIDLEDQQGIDPGKDRSACLVEQAEGISRGGVVRRLQPYDHFPDRNWPPIAGENFERGLQHYSTR